MAKKKQSKPSKRASRPPVKSDEEFAKLPPEMTILSDHPILERNELPDDLHRDDDFQLRARLSAVFDIIRHKNTQTPLAVGVYGDWGTGKSSAMKWLDKQFRTWTKDGETGDHYKVRTLWFEPWKYQTREDVWRGIIAEVIINSIDPEHASFTTVVSAATQFGGFLGRSFLHFLSGIKLKAGASAGVDSTKVAGDATLDLAKLQEIAEDYKRTAHPEKAYLNEFESSLKSWVRQTLGERERLVLFIDDLDRCTPQVTLEVLEALKLYLNIPRLVFVIGLDRSVVRSIVRKHYAEMEVDPKKADKYLDKMFQVELDVTPSQMLIKNYMDAQIAALDEVSEQFWSRTLDACPRKYRHVLETTILTLADGNPREIKRLINSTLLRGHAAARDDKLSEASEGGDEDSRKSSASLRFAQGGQVYLVQKVLDRFVPNSERLLREDMSIGFFQAWSDFRRKYPKFEHAESSDGHTPGRARERVAKLGPQSDPSSQAAIAWSKLRDRVPRNPKGEPHPLLALNHLRELMQIPFSGNVAAAVRRETVVRVHPAEVSIPSLNWPVSQEKREGIVGAKRRRDAPPLDKPLVARLPTAALAQIAERANLQVEELGDRDALQMLELQLDDQALTAEALHAISELRGLRSLSLTACTFLASDAACLATLRELESLWLMYSRLESGSIAWITSLTALRRLFLDATGVKDADIEHLAESAHLRELSLDENKLTDQCIDALLTLQNLKKLWIAGTGMSLAGIERIRLALPNCRLNV